MGLSFFMTLQESGTKSKKVFDEKLKSPKSLWLDKHLGLNEKEEVRKFL